jgi:hypothetical protein
LVSRLRREQNERATVPASAGGAGQRPDGIKIKMSSAKKTKNRPTLSRKRLTRLSEIADDFLYYNNSLFFRKKEIIYLRSPP